MRCLIPVLSSVFILGACGGGQPADAPPRADGESYPQESGDSGSDGADASDGSGDSAAAGENQFQLSDSDSAGSAQGATASKIKATATEAAMKFVVVDKEKGPLTGIVILLTSPDGKKYYTEETDSTGYAEVLVPVGKKYDLVYLSLGTSTVSAQVPVPDEPNQNIKLTLRYQGRKLVKKDGKDTQPGFTLKGVEFDTGKASIRSDSLSRLDGVIEYMTHMKSVRLEISGHTDNVGDPSRNKKLSQQRADSVRNYLISKGIDGSRIQAVGYGDERPVADNGTDEGRQKNRRIEAIELL